MNTLIMEKFLKQFKSMLYRRKERIVLPSENTDNIYYISQGHVMQNIISPNGNQFSPYIFAPGAFFPLIWHENNKCLNSHEYEYESLTPVEVHRIPKEQLVVFLKENPEMALAINGQLETYSCELLKKLKTKVFDDAIHVVISRLLDLARLFGKKEAKQIIINYWFTHQDIANISGLSREVVTIQMNKIMKRGIIGYKGHFIVINDLNILKNELES